MSVYDEIKAERERQNRKWGGPWHDDCHGHRDFCSFIVRLLGEAQSVGGDCDVSEYRRRMVQVAALAVADVERVDRRLEKIHGAPRAKAQEGGPP